MLLCDLLHAVVCELSCLHVNEQCIGLVLWVLEAELVLTWTRNDEFTLQLICAQLPVDLSALWIVDNDHNLAGSVDWLDSSYGSVSLDQVREEALCALGRHIIVEL